MNLLDLNVLELPLHQQLAIKRILTGDTQVFVAEKLGVSQNAISSFESGKVKFPSTYYANLIRYLYQEGK